MSKIEIYTSDYETIIAEAIIVAKSKGEKSISLFSVFRSGPLNRKDEILNFATMWKLFPGVTGSDKDGNWFFE